MLREIYTSFLGARLEPFVATAAASVVTQTVGTGPLLFTSASTGVLSGTIQPGFGRGSMVFVNPSSADVDGGGTAAATTLAGATSFETTTYAHNNGSADDGTAYGMVLGFDHEDATKFTKRAGRIVSHCPRARLEAFVIDAATATASVNAAGCTITRPTATGDILVTFTRPFGSNSVAAAATCTNSSSRVCMIASATAKAVRVKTYNTSSGSLTNAPIFHLLVLGSDTAFSTPALAGYVKNSQRKPRLFAYSVKYGATGVPTYLFGTGDATLVDTGTGVATFTFKDKFARAPVAVATLTGPSLSTVVMPLVSVSTTSISVTTQTAGASSTDPPDGNGFSVMGIGWDDATEYA